MVERVGRQTFAPKVAGSSPTGAYSSTDAARKRPRVFSPHPGANSFQPNILCVLFFREAAVQPLARTPEICRNKWGDPG